MSDLEELEMIETALGCFESPSNSFYLSPDVDEGFGVSGSWDLGIFEISQHEIEFRARKEVHTLLEVSGVSPPIFLSQGIPFGYRFCFCLGEVKDITEFFFKEENFFGRGSFIDLDHLRDEKMFFFSPPIHMFQESPFHLPEFFSVEGPAFSLERLTELDQGIFEIIPEPLHDVEVVVLEGGFGPGFMDDFGEGSPEVEDNTVRMDAPILKFSKKSFSNATAIEPGNGFDIEDSALESIYDDLFISTSSPWHVFIDRESSRELELAEDLREVIFGGKTFLDIDPGRIWTQWY